MIVAPLEKIPVGEIIMLVPTLPLVPVAPTKLKLGTLTPVESETLAVSEAPAELVAITL